MQLRILEPISSDQRIAVHTTLAEAGRPGRDYLLLVVLSCVISSFGLVLNSAAVIIGAMLIAPLMSAILALAVALVQSDLRQFGRALGTLGLGVGLALAISALLGTLVSLGGLNFLEDLPQEILSRTQPTLFDLAIALAGGAAGAYALTQPKLSGTLPGVAIATALMPPLCVAGIGLSQQRLDVSSGALLLFFANFVAIVFASAVIFIGTGFRPAAMAGRRGRLDPALLVPGLLIALVALPLAGFLIHSAQDAQDNIAIRSTLITALGPQGGRFVSFEKTEESGVLQIVATVRVPHDLTYTEGVQMEEQIATRLQRPIALRLLVIPITVLDSMRPPPLTPTPPSPSPAAGASPSP